MNRMLEALKQLESRRAQAPPRAEPAAVEEPALVEEHAPVNDHVAAAAAPVAAEPSVDVLEDLVSRVVGIEEPSAGPAILPEFRAPLFPPAPEWSLSSLEVAPGVEIGPQHRALRDNIASQLPRNMPSALLVTSARGGEGKTATVLPLAAALAELDAGEVLALDGNFRRPGLAESLGVEERVGLTEVLSGKASLQDAIVRTATPRLSVLTMGRSVVADASRLAGLVGELKRHYWIVLADSAAIDEPEPGWPEGFWDGVYLVVRLGQTRRRAAADAVRLLRRRGQNMLGCILTSW